ncbi:hypothetical protein BTM361_15920 [Helicobacter pylori]
MRDLSNDKKQAQAFELQKRQAEQSMDLAKRQQIMSEEAHRQNKRLNEHREKALKLENALNQKQQEWLMKATPSAKASALVSNNAMKKLTTPTTQNTLPTQSITKPKPASMEEITNYINSNPFFRY